MASAKSSGSGKSSGKGGARKSSGLSKATNARRNTQAGRKAMPAAQFGLPGQKKYRIDDAAHARDALGRVAQNGSPTEQAQVRARVARKFPSINVTGVTTRKKKA